MQRICSCSINYSEVRCLTLSFASSAMLLVRPSGDTSVFLSLFNHFFSVHPTHQCLFWLYLTLQCVETTLLGITEWFLCFHVMNLSNLIYTRGRLEAHWYMLSHLLFVWSYCVPHVINFRLCYYVCTEGRIVSKRSGLHLCWFRAQLLFLCFISS